MFISKDAFHDELVRNNLREVAEGDSIRFVYSYEEAETFIENELVLNQNSLDLIITQEGVNLKSFEEFKNALRLDRNRTYSSYDFNLHSIPIFLLAENYHSRRQFRHFEYMDTVSDIGLEKLHRFLPEIVSTVKTWRRSLLDELDNLGITHNSGEIDFSYYLTDRRVKKVNTRILSGNFKRFPRKLQYDWLVLNEVQIEIAVDDFIKEFKRASDDKVRQDEKAFHRLFNKNPFLLKRDNYSDHWYEPRLYLDDKQFYEPDYVLKPNFNHRTDLSIVEIKLPNEQFIKKSKFHPNPYSKILRHLFQVSDYKEYLESDEYQEKVLEAFKFRPFSIEYNLLIGRRENKMADLELLNKRLRQMNMSHINLITYDDLQEYQVKFMERMRLLSVH